MSLEEARRRAYQLPQHPKAKTEGLGIFDLKFHFDEIVELLDWSPLFWAWSLKGKYPQILKHPQHGQAAEELFNDAKVQLMKLKDSKWFRPRARLGIFKAQAQNESIFVDVNGTPHPIHFTRQQLDQPICHCLSDYISRDPKDGDVLGTFAVTSGRELQLLANQLEKDKDDYTSLLLKALGDRLAEALAEITHLRFRELCGIQESLTPEELFEEKYQGIGPAPGYPACPDHSLKADIWQVLGGSEKIGAQLTETFAMDPAGSVSGFMFLHAGSKYFRVGQIGQDQMAELGRHRGQNQSQVAKWLAFQEL